ncbi:hypothetical protein OTU49_003807 [Cherax quadricarinatus]|uniref:Uncharacterized protein n=1 Tax=Cherax quadricarinatus TaxID=27406 RepID=A0AAW0XI87_CHEQU
MGASPSNVCHKVLEPSAQCVTRYWGPQYSMSQGTCVPSSVCHKELGPPAQYVIRYWGPQYSMSQGIESPAVYVRCNILGAQLCMLRVSVIECTALWAPAVCERSPRIL